MMGAIESLLMELYTFHSQICPRQVLGLRIGLAGLSALGFSSPLQDKRLLTIAETDGCFVSGLQVASSCAVNHRNLRVENYGKVAATFVDLKTQRAFRIVPHVDARQRAALAVPDAGNPYQAQLMGYRILPDENLLTVTPVTLRAGIESIVSRAGLRVRCEACGEDIINEREVHQNGRLLCRACFGPSYYVTV